MPSFSTLREPITFEPLLDKTGKTCYNTYMEKIMDKTGKPKKKVKALPSPLLKKLLKDPWAKK